MYDFFAQASSLHTNEQARAIKFYVEPSSVQINRASILELSVHSKCPVRQVPNHTMALRRQRRPYYSTFQRADFKGKTPIRRAVIDNIRKATEMLLIPSRFVFIQFRRFGFSTPSSSRVARITRRRRRFSARS